MPHRHRDVVNPRLTPVGWKAPASAPIIRATRPQRASVPDITLYTTQSCGYCVAAKNFLKSRGLSWNEVRVDLDPQQRSLMMARTQRSSVPQIFINDLHVGGYDDLVALDRAGRLQPLLEGTP